MINHIEYKYIYIYRFRASKFEIVRNVEATPKVVDVAVYVAVDAATSNWYNKSHRATGIFSPQDSRGHIFKARAYGI